MIYLKSLVAGAFVALLSLPTHAQTSPPGQTPQPEVFRRVKGIIESLKGQTLTIKSGDGEEVAVTLPPEVKIITSTKSTLAAIKAGDFVGSAAVKGADGNLHAKEVHIMPGALRGMGEGQRPMGEPETSMTNATITAIDGVVSAPEGRTLKLKYKEGTAEIQVAPNVPVTLMQAADSRALKTGASVSVGAAIKDGELQARFISVEPVE
jgi:hypothetical protein